MSTKDLPGVFLAVASEARDVLAPVLDRHPMRATVLMDRDGETYRHPEKISRADIEKAMRLRATSETRPGRLSAHP